MEKMKAHCYFISAATTLYYLIIELVHETMQLVRLLYPMDQRCSLILLQWILPFVMCMLSVIPGIAGTQVFCLYWKVGRYRMVSEHSVACRIETLGLETIGWKLCSNYLRKFYSTLVYSFILFWYILSCLWLFKNLDDSHRPLCFRLYAFVFPYNLM